MPRFVAKSVGGFTITLPDGVYEGTWGGYDVEMDVAGYVVTFRVDMGIRGMNEPCLVDVKDGVAFVNAKDR